MAHLLSLFMSNAAFPFAHLFIVVQVIPDHTLTKIQNFELNSLLESFSIPLG